MFLLLGTAGLRKNDSVYPKNRKKQTALSENGQVVIYVGLWEAAMSKIVLSGMLVLLLPFFAAAQSRSDTDETRSARTRMVREQIEARGITAPAVLKSLQAVPRHFFVPQDALAAAYADHPLPIGEGQTISQPYIVALMTDVLDLKPGERVLEIGTGSGYQSAVLSQIAAMVYTIEIKKKLYENAQNLLKLCKYKNVVCRHGDGYFGWPEAAPFDAVMITAAVDHVPPPLLEQLKPGGRLVLPLGSPFGYQNLVQVTRHADDTTVRQITGVLFVPMTGHALDRVHP
jgi:protein-L-isoaspartate(D-aspartate) O-methyltransferase